ncbi:MULTISPECIES: hypothetical protein [Streptomyces]|uniref:hypothetical protein n=1 Tax=Streptomyces TaxID=1883 RepID=UPI000978DC5E|nr:MULTISPECIES: hypothetical protein [unclassified Streptomyces]ONI53313.1 hypothetical protein STIB_26660 [Streptomyces sp. IB2014 011-1]RDV48009.1 hypothetical protein DDV98_30615 [Streptomyces sp. IB2014 011-12]CAD5926550.1 conserved exported protein of unknown function [Streptomyces sp. KY70]CAD5990028.1 conserved exported protein of unknown function [Streptomyces sp. KY75]
MSGHRWAARAAAAAAAVALTVTGGAVAQADDDIASLTAEQIADRSRDALLGVSSLHLSARGDLDGSGDRMSVDLTLDREGNCAGGVDMGEDGSVEIVKRADDVWLKPDKAFWETHVPIGGSTFDAILDGRYMKAKADDPRLLTVTEVCDLDTFRELITDNPGATERGTLTKGRETEVNGAPVIPVTRTQGTERLTVDVVTEGEPYPVRITVRGADEEGTVSFSGFDRPVPAETPSASDTVDVTALLGRSVKPT